MKTKTKLLDDIEANIRKGGGATAKQAKARDGINGELNRLRGKIIQLEDVLATPTRKSFRFAIYYNKMMLDSDPLAKQRFMDEVLIPHYTNKGLPDPKASAQNTLSRILEENAEELEDLRSGMVGGAKHLKLRKTDLDEWQVNDFILKNTDVIHTYAQRMGRRIEFARSYGGDNIDDIVEKVTDAMVEAKRPKKEIAEIRAAFYGEYDRTMGALQEVLTEWTTSYQICQNLRRMGLPWWSRYICCYRRRNHCSGTWVQRCLQGGCSGRYRPFYRQITC